MVDASAVVQACLSADGCALPERSGPVAPPLLWSEAASALHELRWRRSISEELASVAMTRFDRCPVRRAVDPRLPRAAWEVAGELGWAKTYDAEYAALARLLGCPLVTIDGRLQRAATRLVEVIGPTQL